MIIQLDEARLKLASLRNDAKELGISMRVDDLRASVEELEEKTHDQNFWNDQVNSGKILQEIKQKKYKIEQHESLVSSIEDTYTLCELSLEENDESSLDDILSEVERIERDIEKMNIDILLSGEYDRNNAILSFHPGAGGQHAKIGTAMRWGRETRWV